MDGGPGIPALSLTHYQLLAGKQLPRDLQDVANIIEEISDYEIKEKITEIVSCNTEASYQACLEKHMDWLISIGANLTEQRQLVHRNMLMRDMIRYYLYDRVERAARQFRRGLGEVWDLMACHTEAMRPLFVAPAEDPLTQDAIRRLYDVDFSAERSNRREKKEETIYTFELFLEYCAC